MCTVIYYEVFHSFLVGTGKSAYHNRLPAYRESCVRIIDSQRSSQIHVCGVKQYAVVIVHEGEISFIRNENSVFNVQRSHVIYMCRFLILSGYNHVACFYTVCLQTVLHLDSKSCLVLIGTGNLACQIKVSHYNLGTLQSTVRTLDN